MLDVQEVPWWASLALFGTEPVQVPVLEALVGSLAVFVQVPVVEALVGLPVGSAQAPVVEARAV